MPIGQTSYPMAVDDVADLIRAVDDAGGKLTAPVGAADTVLPMDQTGRLPASGVATVEGEHVAYAAKTATSLTGCQRGMFLADGGRPAGAHPAGADVEIRVIAPARRVLVDAIRAVQTELGPQGNRYVRADAARLRTPEVSVASAFATNHERDNAHYRCDNQGDEVEINAAIAVLGDGGGVVRLLGPDFNTAGAILLRGGVAVVGQGRSTTTIGVSSPNAAVRVAEPGERNQHAAVRDVDLYNAGATPDGIDFRGFVRSDIERVRIYGFGRYGVRLGGDLPPYESCWSNVVRDCFVDQCPTCVRFDGLTAGGVPNANATLVDRCELIPTNAAGSVGVDLFQGAENWITHCDIGYAPEATGVALRAGATRCVLADNRFEDIGAPGNASSAWPVEIAAGSDAHQIKGNSYVAACKQPGVRNLDPGGYSDVMDAYNPTTDFPGGSWDLGRSVVFRRPPVVRVPAGTDFFDLRRADETRGRVGLGANGALYFYDPTDPTRTPRAGWYLRSESEPTVLAGIDDAYHALPRLTVAPPLNAAGRGVLARREGAAGESDRIVVVRKNAAGGYEEAEVAVVAAGGHDRHVIAEDFVSGSVGSGSVGATNWVGTGVGGMVKISGEVEHPGIVRIATGAVTNQFWWLATAAEGVSMLRHHDEAVFIFRPSAVTNVYLQIGLGNDPATRVSANGLWLDLIPGDTTWRWKRRIGGVEERQDLGVAAVAGAWLRLRLAKVANYWSVAINDNEPTTITTNPVAMETMGTVVPGLFVQTAHAAAKWIDVDYARVTFSGMIR